MRLELVTGGYNCFGFLNGDSFIKPMSKATHLLGNSDLLRLLEAKHPPEVHRVSENIRGHKKIEKN